MKIDKMINVCNKISKDIEDDASKMDGQSFTGLTVATYLGYQAAAINCLAELIKEILEDKKSTS